MLKRALIILSGVIIFIVLFLHSPFISLFEFLGDFDTEYTKDFSYKKFVQVKNGMTKEEVVMILGEPLDELVFPYPSIDSGTYEECYQYSQAKPKNMTIQRYGDINWHQVLVCFFDEKVFVTTRNTFFN